MAVQGSATVTSTVRGDMHIIKWEYLTEDASGLVEDVGSITNIYGEVLGIMFIPLAGNPVDDNYDMLILAVGDGMEWDICQGLALDMPVGNAFHICPTADTVEPGHNRSIHLWDETLTIQSGTVIGTSTDIGNAAQAGIIYLFLKDPRYETWR